MRSVIGGWCHATASALVALCVLASRGAAQSTSNAGANRIQPPLRSDLIRASEPPEYQWGYFIWVDRTRTQATRLVAYFRWADTHGNAPTPQAAIWKRDSTPDAIWVPLAYRTDNSRRMWLDIQPDVPQARTWVCLMFVGKDGQVAGGRHWDPAGRDSTLAHDCGN